MPVRLPYPTTHLLSPACESYSPSPLLPSPAVPPSYPPASPPLPSQPLSQPPSPLLSTKRHIDGSPKAPPPPPPPSSTPSVSAWPPSSATTSSKGPAKWLSQPTAKGSQSAPAANRKRVRSLGGGKGSQSSGRGSQSSGRGKPGPIQLEIGAFFVASQGQRKKEEEEEEEDDFDLAELQSEEKREPRREDKGKARQLAGGMDAEEQEKRQTQGQEKEKGQGKRQEKEKGQEQMTPRVPPEWARQMKEASTHEKMDLSQGEEAREAGAGESATWHGSPSQRRPGSGMAQQGPSGVGRDGESRQEGAAWEREGVDMRSPAARQPSWPPMSKPTPTKQSQEEGEEGEEEEGEEDMSMDLLGEEKQSFVLEEQGAGEEEEGKEGKGEEGEREGEKECMPPPPPRTPGSATRRPIDQDHSQPSHGGSGEDSQSPTQTGRVEEGGEAGEEQGQNQCGSLAETFGLGEGSAMSASQPGGGDTETDRGDGERPADVCLEGSSILVEATQETGLQARSGLGRVVLDTQARPVEGLQEEGVEGSSILVEPTQEGQLISGRSGLGRVVLDTQALAVAPMGEEEMGGKGVLHDAPVLAEATQEGRRGGGGVVLDTQAVAPFSQSHREGESETAEGREGVEGSSILVEATQEGQAVGRRSGMGRVVLDTQAVAAAACEEETESAPLLQGQEEGAMDGPMDEAASEEATEGRSEGGESEGLKSPAHTSHHTPGRQPLSDMPDIRRSLSDMSDTPQPQPDMRRSQSDTPQPPSDMHRSQSDTPDILVPPTPDSGGFGLFNRGKHVGPGRVVLGTQEMEAMQPDHASLREDQQGEEEGGEEVAGQWGMQASLPMLEGQGESCVREGQGSSSNPEESFVEVPPTPLDGPPVRRGGGIVRDTQAVQREEEEGEGQGETAASLTIAMSPSREEGGEEDEERSQVIEMTMGEEKEEEEEEGPGEARQGHRGQESGGSSTTIGHSRSDDSEGAEGQQAEEETATMDGPCGPIHPPPEVEGATCPQSPLSNREAEGEGAGETMSQGALSQEGLNQGVLSQGTVVEEDERPASPPPAPHPCTAPPPNPMQAHPFSPPLPPARRASENSPTDGPPATSPNGTSGGGSLNHGSLIGSSLMGGASFLGSLFSQPSLAPGLTADSPSRSQVTEHHPIHGTQPSWIHGSALTP